MGRRRNMRATFLGKFKLLAQEYQPVEVNAKIGTLFARRNVRLAIREAAKRKTQVRILYRKVAGDKATKIYLVAPMAFRTLNSPSAGGRRRFLYAWDAEKEPHQRADGDSARNNFQGTIKAFVLRNILNTQVTEEPYPRRAKRFPVEIR